MSDPSDRYGAFIFLRDLSHDRALAAALGDMIVVWAEAERNLIHIAEKVLRVNYSMVADIFSRVPTFESRIKIVRALVAEWIEPGPSADSLLKLLDRLRVVFDMRTPKGVRARRKSVKAHDVANHVTTVRKCSDELPDLLSALQPRSDLGS